MSAQLFPMLRNASLVALLAMPGVSYAEDILTVAANGKSESFSMDELLAMSQATVVTNNDYLDRSTTFTGPSLRGILDRFEVGRESDLTIAAINDFSVVIPAANPDCGAKRPIVDCIAASL